MVHKKKPPVGYDENPEWTAEDFAKARPAGEVLPPEVVAAFGRKRGRPAGSDKEQVSLRLDKAVIAKFKADGPGWQSRMNEALRKVAGL